MLLKSGQTDEAHQLLKEALTTHFKDPSLRAVYTHFLIQINELKAAKKWVWDTLKLFNKHDIYALCATGWIQYHQARETRDPKANDARKEGFQRAAEFYEKALGLDPACVYAAQGLAIITAEDALGTLGGQLPPGPQPDDNAKRLANAREALDVFSKVRESLDDGSVYINIGHCYFSRDDFDRAIESVSTFT
jgi:RNA polymerase-associated protein CTR9